MGRLYQPGGMVSRRMAQNPNRILERSQSAEQVRPSLARKASTNRVYPQHVGNGVMGRFCVIGMVLLVICLAAPRHRRHRMREEISRAIVRVTSTAPGEARIAGTLGTT